MKWDFFVFDKNNPTPPPPLILPNIFWYSKNVGNSIKHEENIKWDFLYFWQFIKKFKQHPSISKKYTAHPNVMMHAPAKFRENTAMRVWVSVKTKSDRWTDRQMDGFQYLPSAWREIIKHISTRLNKARLWVSHHVGVWPYTDRILV